MRRRYASISPDQRRLHRNEVRHTGGRDGARGASQSDEVGISTSMKSACGTLLHAELKEHRTGPAMA